MKNQNKWFRLYHEFATDPKVQMLSEADQRRYIMILCLRCSNGDVTLHDNEVAFQLRVTDDEWIATKERLMGKNLITKDNKPVAWDSRQYNSDSSSERVRRHRDNKKQACNVTVTAPDTDTDTDTETDKKEKDKKEKSFLLPDWVNPSAWADFAQHRKEIKKGVFTDLAKNKAANLLKNLSFEQQQQVVDYSIRGGYPGLYPEKCDNPGPANRSPPGNFQTAGQRRTSGNIHAANKFLELTG